MNQMQVINDQFLDEYVKLLQVPDTMYDSANKSFNSICDWFVRADSTIKDIHIESYLQGSFRLGTAIKPTTDEDDYDIDIATVLNQSKFEISQHRLKCILGVEILSHSKRYNMKPPINARRCWTQEYADDRQFHMDILPAIPDKEEHRIRLEAREQSLEWSENVIAITDQKNSNYKAKNPNWLVSNPKDYALWFEKQMQESLDSRKQAIALNEGKYVGDIPTYRAKTTLQKSIQLLKHHRDIMFAGDPDDRPISIIITTLSAKAYNHETTTASALQTILTNMKNGIEIEHGIDWVRNPTNPLENFADKWPTHPKRRENFYKWLETAKDDFAKLRIIADNNERNRLLSEAFGDELQKRFTEKQSQNAIGKLLKLSKRTFLPAQHRESPPWMIENSGNVKIYRAVKNQNGFRTKPFSSDSIPIKKNAKLKFFARTDIPRPFQVYWQIVNTGEEANRANDQRGGFDVGAIHSGNLTRQESTSYSGSHSIECFIVKDGYLRANSGQFIVNIE